MLCYKHIPYHRHIICFNQIVSHNRQECYNHIAYRNHIACYSQCSTFKRDQRLRRQGLGQVSCKRIVSAREVSLCTTLELSYPVVILGELCLLTSPPEELLYVSCTIRNLTRLKPSKLFNMNLSLLVIPYQEALIVCAFSCFVQICRISNFYQGNKINSSIYVYDYNTSCKKQLFKQS